MTDPKNTEKGHGEFVVVDDAPPLVKPGVYELAYVGYETARMFRGKAHKLIVWFRIVSMGKYFETILPRYYNVQNVASGRTKNGNFKVGTKSDFLREHFALFPGPVKRRDRIPMSRYEDCIIKGSVCTVNEYRGRPIPKDLQYSRIERLLGVVR